MFHNSGINKAILVGAICNQPEWKYINSEKFLCFMLVTRETFSRQNVNQEHSEFHHIKVPESIAANDTKSLSEGAEVYLEGRVTTTSGTDTMGIKRYDTTILTSRFNIMKAAQKAVTVE